MLTCLACAPALPVARQIYMTEIMGSHRQGMAGAFITMCATSGTALGNTAVMIVQAACTPEQLLVWGWRIPFLLAAATGLLVSARFVGPWRRHSTQRGAGAAAACGVGLAPLLHRSAGASDTAATPRSGSLAASSRVPPAPIALQSLLLRLHMPESHEFVAARAALKAGADPKDLTAEGAGQPAHCCADPARGGLRSRAQLLAAAVGTARPPCCAGNLCAPGRQAGRSPGPRLLHGSSAGCPMMCARRLRVCGYRR